MVVQFETAPLPNDAALRGGSQARNARNLQPHRARVISVCKRQIIGKAGKDPVFVHSLFKRPAPEPALP